MFALVVCVCLTICYAQAETKGISSAEIPFEELYRATAQVEALKFRNSVSKSSPHREFYDAFDKTDTLLRGYGLDMSRWFRGDHIGYIAESLKPHEQQIAVGVFEKISRRVINGEKNMDAILLGAGPGFLMTKISDIDREIIRLKAQHKEIIKLAIQKHETENGQMYGEFNYSFHLREVREVLKRFGFGPKDSLFGLFVGSAAWLHDILEDTDLLKSEIATRFGRPMATTTLGVTKLDKRPEWDSAEHLRRTYLRTRKDKGSRILKLADRIANVERGLVYFLSGEPSKVHKYFKEWLLFRDLLYVPGEADAAWKHLEQLLTNPEYARQAVQGKTKAYRAYRCEKIFSPVVASP